MDAAPKRRIRLVTRGGLVRLGVLVVVGAPLALLAVRTMTRMPGASYDGPLPVLDGVQRESAAAMRRDVEMLAGEIGPRSVLFPRALDASATYLQGRLESLGYEVSRQCFKVGGAECCNIEAERPGRGRPEEIIVVGGHYDSVTDDHVTCPGANDNATGAAATIELARALADASPDRTVRFVLFVNEEPPFFRTDDMGSLVYARRCRSRGENIVAMISLETIGCYFDGPGTQQYPAGVGLLYPSTGNFIAFVGNLRSRRLVRRSVATFRTYARFPSEGAALPGFIAGVGWSDQWAFWKNGYEAIMVTDTAPFRYPHYHRVTDTPDKIDYERMAMVVSGVEAVVRDLASGR
jgi:hypothetical protein